MSFPNCHNYWIYVQIFPFGTLFVVTYQTEKITAAINGTFKSGWIVLLLNLILYFGPVYLGKAGKTIKFWLLSILAYALLFVGFVSPLFINSLISDADTQTYVQYGLMIGGGVLFVIATLWWLFDLFFSFSDTRNYNYQKFLDAISA